MRPSLSEVGIMPEGRESAPDLSLSPLSIEVVQKRDEAGREYKCQREWREWRAADGKTICKVMVDVQQETSPLIPDDPELEVYDGHQLDAVVLVHPDTGKTFDVLQQFNQAGVPIIVDSLIEQTGWRLDPHEVIMIPPLKSPLEIQYLLHELYGHSGQFRDPVLGPLLVDYYDQSSEAARGKTEKELAPGVAAIKKALPHLGSVSSKEWYKLFDLAEQITERDAERKSLEAIDRIRRETGIDLLVPFWWEPSKFADTPYWRASEAENAKTAARLSSDDIELQNPSFRLKGPAILTIKDEIRRYLQFVKAVQGQMFGGGDRLHDLEEQVGLAGPIAQAA